jgi:transcription initiation factor TFIIB
MSFNPINGSSSAAPALRRAEIAYKLMCPQCRNPTPNLIEEFSAGDLVCGDCGTVVGDRIIDTRSEWRTFTSDSGGGGAGDDPSRVGGPGNPLLDTAHLETIISSRDGFTGASRELGRLQGKTSFRSGERNLLAAFKSISMMCERIGLPRLIADRGKQLYKLVEDEKLTKGKVNDGIVAACIYVACRQEKVPRTFKEISALTLVSKKDIGRCYKLIAPLLENRVSSVSMEDFMARFCSHLNLGIDVHRLAVAILKRVSELGVAAGKSPTSISAAGLFMATQLIPQSRKSPKDIAFISGVSEVTIKNTYKDLLARKYELIPTELVTKAAIDNLTPF